MGILVLLLLLLLLALLGFGEADIEFDGEIVVAESDEFDDAFTAVG
jgi:hypothetical protein